ncbi:MAG TPA: class I SAM-dependent methyltransferase [Stellaceae bacterium]|nr:class I SAM-dependent methyltransferase [Stellaceae bacterium]
MTAPAARCPFCGGAPRAADGALVCPSCGAGGRCRANVVDWRGEAGREPSPVGRNALWRNDMTAADNLRRLGRAVRFCVDPVTSPLSPLAWLARARLRRYYDRTRDDPDLARRWAEHYLAGMPPPPMRVLDHGTGRGRHVGILSQLGCDVAAQDVAPDPWWSNFDRCRFQVVPPECDRLPWAAASFDLVLDWMVIENFTSERLARLAAEIARVLAPGGHWLILTANDEGLGAHVPRRNAGRLHALDAVNAIAAANGMAMMRHSYEGFYAPVLPVLVNAIRKTCAPRPLDLADYDTVLARLVAPRRRALWLAAFRNARG